MPGMLCGGRKSHLGVGVFFLGSLGPMSSIFLVLTVKKGARGA